MLSNDDISLCTFTGVYWLVLGGAAGSDVVLVDGLVLGGEIRHSLHLTLNLANISSRDK